MSDLSDTTTPDEALFYTFQEACRVLKVDERTLRKALDENRLPYLQLGDKTIRIPKEAVHVWSDAS